MLIRRDPTAHAKPPNDPGQHAAPQLQSLERGPDGVGFVALPVDLCASSIIR